MNIVFLYCLLIFGYSKKSVLADFITCNSTSQEIFLNTDEIIFFESLNFPQTIEDNCAITFIIENYRNLESLRSIFVITNGMIDFMLTSNQTRKAFLSYYLLYGRADGSQHLEIPSIIKTNDTNLTFETTIIDTENYNAFQGFIIAEDGAFRCPLESIATINPFNITNKNQIIYLTNFVSSDFFEVLKNKTSCTWRFAAPQFYQFKLVILSFDGELPTLHILDGNGNVVKITKDTVKLSFPYLIVGPYISITFQSDEIYDDDNHPSQDQRSISFNSYLTIHKPQSDYTDGNCTFTDGGDTLTWTNIGYPLQGYQDNAYCFLNQTLFSNRMTIATIDTQMLEYNVDYLKYSIQDEQVIATDQIVGVTGGTFVFQSHLNGYNSYLVWEFFSDSSYNALGFSITFTHMDCSCASPNITVPCSETQYTIMPGEDIYCGNLRCNFSISIDPACSEQNLIMQIIEDNDAFGRPNANSFRVFSNNMTVVESVAETNTYIILLPTNNTNQLVFESAPAQKLATFIYILTPINAPTFLPVIFLTKSSPSHILHFGQILANSVTPIFLNDDLIKENDTLEIYVNSGSFPYISLYEDAHLIHIIIEETYFNPVDKYAKYYTSKTGKFFIYRYSDVRFTDSDIIFFRARKEHSKNCLFKNIIFDARKAANANNKITMTATPEGPCKIHILNTPFFQEDYDHSNPFRNYIMTEFWTNSHQENVKIYVDNNENVPFIEYVSSNGSAWNDINLGSQIYSIIIPAGKSIAILFKTIFEDISMGDYPYKTLWTSPFFGSTTQAYDTAVCGSFAVKEHMSAKLTTKIFNVPENFDNAITFAGTTSFPSHVGETFFFSNTTILIFCQTNGEKNIAVLFEIESFNGDYTNITTI